MAKVDLVEAGKATRFQKGHAAHPNAGRPKSKPLRHIAREIVDEPDPTKKKIARELIEALIAKAKGGSLAHFQQVLKLVEEDLGTEDWASPPLFAERFRDIF